MRVTAIGKLAKTILSTNACAVSNTALAVALALPAPALTWLFTIGCSQMVKVLGVDMLVPDLKALSYDNDQRCSPKMMTDSATAVTGSIAPNTAVAVEPIAAIEIFIKSSEIMVGTMANRAM